MIDPTPNQRHTNLPSPAHGRGAGGEGACRVCGDPISADRLATCNNCHEPFHLRSRQDHDGADCGEVWIHEQYLSLEFACFICLGKAPGGPTEPGVGTAH